MTTTYNSEKLKQSLKREAKALGIPSGFANDFIQKIITTIDKTLKDKKIVTTADINRIIIKESSKYSPDFAYVYQNKSKII